MEYEIVGDTLPVVICHLNKGEKMISDIDYMKFAMSQESDKTEIDPVLRSRAWSAVILGLAMFWSIIELVVCNVWIIS